MRTELKSIEQRKERQVAGRREHMTVSLVGYTNAGKSTLMNRLTSAGVLVEDKLFATLDTRTRRWHLPHWGPVLLSDTVGFIRDLPHRLIASFKATLEEARQADLLLHVADASSPSVLDQISAVYDVLEEIGIQEKHDAAGAQQNRQYGVARAAGVCAAALSQCRPGQCSYRRANGRLALAVSDALSRSFRDVDVEMGVENGKLLAFLARHGEVLSKQYDGDARDASIVAYLRSIWGAFPLMKRQ